MTSLYQIDSTHSSANFSVKHMMIAKVHGSFEKLSGKFIYDPQNLSKSRVEAAIETASISTREGQRDNHLKSADFLNVEKFPVMTFVGSDFKKKGDEIEVRGKLTIKDITKDVTLMMEEPSAEIKDPRGNLKIGLSAKTKINRKDFGLSWNGALEIGGVLVGEEVSIALDIQFIKSVE